MIARLRDFAQRCRWAMNAFAHHTPVVQLGNSVTVNLDTREIHIPSDFRISVDGTFTLAASGHVVFLSGRDQEERPGYLHSVWFNPQLDELGRPIQEPHQPPTQEATYDEC